MAQVIIMARIMIVRPRVLLLSTKRRIKRPIVRSMPRARSEFIIIKVFSSFQYFF